MKTPAATDGFSIYKIGDKVTFAWNYTDLIISPTAVDVVASCSAAATDFTIASNLPIKSMSVTWDTGKFQQTGNVRLPVATYTLYVFDSKGSKTDTPQVGRLGPFSGPQFGMYTPQSYTPLKDFECPTCDPNQASGLDKYALRMMVGMGLIAATSFTWFVAGLRL